MVIAAPELFSATQRLDARITLLASAKTMKNRARVHFHQGTSETITEVLLLDREKLAPGESAFAQLRLREPILALPGDRFILRQFSPVITIGGGVVIDPLASRHRKNDSRTIPFLEEARDAMTVRWCSRHWRKRNPRGMDLAQLVARTGWLESEVRQAARRACGCGARANNLSDQPLVIASSNAVTECIDRLRKEIEKFHAANPLVARNCKRRPQRTGRWRQCAWNCSGPRSTSWSQPNRFPSRAIWCSARAAKSPCCRTRCEPRNKLSGNSSRRD